jgi:hypothetical protein
MVSTLLDKPCCGSRYTAPGGRGYQEVRAVDAWNARYLENREWRTGKGR